MGRVHGKSTTETTISRSKDTFERGKCEPDYRPSEATQYPSSYPTRARTLTTFHEARDTITIKV